MTLLESPGTCSILGAASPALFVIIILQPALLPAAWKPWTLNPPKVWAVPHLVDTESKGGKKWSVRSWQQVYVRGFTFPVSGDLVMVGQVYCAYLTLRQVGFGCLSHQQPAEPCVCWVFVHQEQGNVTASTKWLPAIELQEIPRLLVLALCHEQG